jgi:hypothetical protein
MAAGNGKLFINSLEVDFLDNVFIFEYSYSNVYLKSKFIEISYYLKNKSSKRKMI